MAAVAPEAPFDPRFPINLSGADFARHKYEWYRWMLEEAPVTTAKMVMKVKLVARYEDCRMVLTDERFGRNRGRVTGKGSASPLPIPLPKSVAAIATSMIQQDDPEHRRLRNLVSKAFTPRAVGALQDRVEDLSNELLDRLEKEGGETNLLETFARPVPTRVIAQMLGIGKQEMEPFEHGLRVLTQGFSGMSIVRTLLWDLRRTTNLVRDIIARKRNAPADDILSALIAVEDQGDRLDEGELVAMVFLLILAGFETTMHLIANSVRTLLEHPDSLDRLRGEPELWDSAVEELLRHRSPVQGTKPQWAKQDVELHGVTVEKGSPVIPLLGAANHDPRVFDNPDRFDIARSPNPHLGFGFGMHFCLGAQLARMETRVALRNLFARFPDLRLAVDPSQLEIVNIPGWHRHAAMPVVLG